MSHPNFIRIHAGVATLENFHPLINRNSNAPFDAVRSSGERDVGRWFETDEEVYQYSLGCLPPIWIGHGAFAISEALTNRVHPVHLRQSIHGEDRYFFSYCDLASKDAVTYFRAAVIERLKAPDAHILTREEQLEEIWNSTAPDMRHFMGSINPEQWHPDSIGKRSILAGAADGGCTVLPLDKLTDSQIQHFLPQPMLRVHGNGQPAA